MRVNGRLAADELYSEAIELWNRDSTLDTVDRTLEFFTNFYLQDDILAKVDRAGMMSSLESRAIFLDNEVVSFCQRLPNQLKYRRGTRKYLLKKAVAGLVPQRILRRGKKGFGVPLAKWLRSVPVTLPVSRVDDANLSYVERAWRDHRAGRADHRLFLWSWLSLQAVLSNRVAGASNVGVT